MIPQENGRASDFLVLVSVVRRLVIIRGTRSYFKIRPSNRMKYSFSVLKSMAPMYILWSGAAGSGSTLPNVTPLVTGSDEMVTVV
jgi:hypothetical protein